MRQERSQTPSAEGVRRYCSESRAVNSVKNQGAFTSLHKSTHRSTDMLQETHLNPSQISIELNPILGQCWPARIGV
jgi:hypothetical protein